MKSKVKGTVLQSKVKGRVLQILTVEDHLQLMLQYDGSNDDLDCRIDFRYLDFICIIKYLRSRLIKDCAVE